MRYTSENRADVVGVEAVYLDGVKLKGVYEADTDEGFVIVRAVDEQGRFKIDRARGEVIRERGEGVVTVTLREGVKVGAG